MISAPVWGSISLEKVNDRVIVFLEHKQKIVQLPNDTGGIFWNGKCHFDRHLTLFVKNGHRSLFQWKKKSMELSNNICFSIRTCWVHLRNEVDLCLQSRDKWHFGKRYCSSNRDHWILELFVGFPRSPTRSLFLHWTTEFIHIYIIIEYSSHLSNRKSNEPLSISQPYVLLNLWFHCLKPTKQDDVKSFYICRNKWTKNSGSKSDFIQAATYSNVEERKGGKYENSTCDSVNCNEIFIKNK